MLVVTTQAQTVYKLGDRGVTAPVLLTKVAPTYPPEARAEGVQGRVIVEAVVLPTGRVGADLRAVRSELWRYRGPQARDEGPAAFLSDEEVAKFGLDKEAVAALRRWTFRAGTKDGKSVPVRMLVEVPFALTAARGV